LRLLFAGANRGAGRAITSDKVSFYFAAHEDDWQLFINPNAFENAFEDVLGGATATICLSGAFVSQ
jgi:hypothetical protein